ncbi:hypothetical protein GUJ93_ZPchr0007g4230 [Zizania palustris]|uniref:RRM domain-containing protein n=1 Tax=Zizania palustris TaxID=103762 RepID=A0A8J5TDI1_ZIZPA|nr:hypothetical protein GUJ93_ZPchr0007g4230 [Zizania palustris]
MAEPWPLFDLNVAPEDVDWDEEPEGMVEEEVEVEVVVLDEEEPEGVIMEDATAAATVEEEAEEAKEVVVPEAEAEVEAEAEAKAEAEAEAEAEGEEGEVERDGDAEAMRKKNAREVLVGGLPQDAAEEDVAQALAEAGDVEEVRLVRDPAEPRCNKGFAFVRFAAAWQARWAADDVRTAMIKGKACGICKNDGTKTLHLRNICFDWTKDDLAEELKSYKLENLEDISLVEHLDIKGKNRGYAFLEFSTHVDAADAFFKLQNTDIYLGTDVSTQVSFSKTIAPDDKVMEKVKSVFLDGLPPHWNEDKVREVFGKFGQIDTVQLARNMVTAKRKDFGFIGFASRQSALDCISTFSTGGAIEGSGKVRIKASLQRPRNTFKKHSWKRATPMGIRRGFVDKRYGDNGSHPSKFRHSGHAKHDYSSNPFHDKYHHQPMVGRLSRMEEADVEERRVSSREYSSHYRRYSPVSGPSHRYGRTHREAYVESRYAYEYPKHRETRHGESIQRDAYRSKYAHSYPERPHRDFCPECNPCDHSSRAYYYKTGHEPMHSSSQAVSQSEKSYSQGRQLMPSGSYVLQEQNAAPASSQVAPPPHQIAKPFHEQSSSQSDDRSAYEAETEYTFRARRSRYPSSRDDADTTHHKKYHRQGR